jgi:hypothetical protein
MAQEIKNTFLKAKMNKDLDDRIMPNGEYRDALNISVGRSEADNVGSVENLIGNVLISQTNLGDFTIIGKLVDSSNDRVFVFLTDYTDANPQESTDAPPGSLHYIYVFNTVNQSYTRLVQGEFLNFSTTNRIIGVNLIESLLFWTDNRNQPRKINIDLASSTVQSARGSSSNTDSDYYTEEHQISVAKYAPYESINLVNRLRVINTGTATSYIRVEGDRVEELTPFIGGIIVSPEDNVSGEDYCTIVSLALVGSETRINIEPNLPGGNSATPGAYYTLFSSTMTNKKDDPTWPGDPDYLEDRFVRFSYRFKYDDNEYSLIAPFTQIAYIPKQKGYFVHGQEEAAYRSTVLDWFENNVQNIELNIPLPCPGNRLSSHYKVAELEILFRESDSVAIKVLESVTSNEVSAFSKSSNIYTYDYQSRKPYKTLSEAQTVRVYDKVPVRAQSQEVSGNRVIYGNYYDQHTPPESLNYNCRINRKLETGKYNNFVEYPTHTVKRNRNYQVGFVLSDKFGRTSPVILSNVDLGATEGGKFYSGSTIYSPYDSGPDDTPDILEWFGDTIQVLVNEAISSNKNLSAGTPGLYAIETQRDTSGEGYAVLPDDILINGNTYQFRWDPNYLNNKNLPAENDYLRGQFEDFVEVESIEEIDPALNLYQVITDGQVNESYLRGENIPANSPDLKFAYRLNDLGWYSYKIVVKQTEQEYYNAYLPGILNGYPGQAYKWTELSTPSTNPDDDGKLVGDFTLTLSGYKFPNELDLTAHTVLFNDNINKIPRDLAEVGPDQKQYRSSVVLYGRVTNTMIPAYGPTWGEPRSSYEFDREHLSKAYNTQYYPRTIASGVNAIKHVATQVGNSRDMQMGLDDLSPSALKLPVVGLYGADSGGEGGQDVFYSLDTNPLIAKISTEDKSIGWPNVRPAYDFKDWEPEDDDPIAFSYPQNMLPYLAIYETEPVESLLDIYWETTSTGLIVDLNADINSFAGAALAVEGYSWDFDESMTKGDLLTTPFRPIDGEGNPYVLPPSVEIASVSSPLISDASGMFSIREVSGQTGFFEILFEQENIQFLENSFNNDVYSFVLNVETQEGFTSQISIPGQPGGNGALANVVPDFTDFVPSIAGVAQNEVTSSDSIIVAANWPGSDNGAFEQNGGTGDPYTNGLVYSFEMRNNSGIPDTWEMNSANGELSCTAGATPTGIYQIRLILTDAGDTNEGTGDFAAKTKTQDMDVIIGYPAVNPGALTTQANLCILNPFESQSAPPPADNFKRMLDSDPNQNPNGAVDGIWYLSKDSSTQFELPGVAPSDPIPGYGNMFSSATEGGNTVVYRLGPYDPQSTPISNHLRGTITFTINYVDQSVGGSTPMPYPSVYMFYRIEGDDEWIKLDDQPGFNYNNTKSMIDLRMVANAEGELPLNSDGADRYITIVRAFDWLDFTGAEGGVEYAVLVRGFEKETTLAGNSRVWVQTDDLHYPVCIPRMGKNAANEPSDPLQDGPGKNSEGSFTYKRSLTTNAIENLPIENNLFLYAETPYLEYVNAFYTDEALTTVYVPPDNATKFNFTWTGDEGSGAANLWQWMVPAVIPLEVTLKAVAEFGNNDAAEPGEKLRPSSENTTSARQTTYSPDINEFGGITRFVIKPY